MAQLLAKHVVADAEQPRAERSAVGVELRKGRERAAPGLLHDVLAVEAADAALANLDASPGSKVVRQLGVTEQTYYRWRKEYGGMKVDQARRLKELEKENARLKRLLADAHLDNAILKEAAEGNF